MPGKVEKGKYDNLFGTFVSTRHGKRNEGKLYSDLINIKRERQKPLV